MKKITLITTGIATGLVVVAIGTYLIAGNAQREEAGNQGVSNIKQLVHDFSTRKATAQSASITSSQLSVSEDATTTKTYDLPANEFFVSIAPYTEQTHPCATHSLTGCQGEMKDKEFNVTIHDSAGNSVMNKALVKSQSNGFIDLWLPRDKTYSVTVEHKGKTAKSQISTFENDDTCITTMQLG
ncbi:CueP family metal-binding protein [Paenibacillus sp. 1-18]|uniref:CueP family metal-binding protein n=1 Tax=Paenibacillus sp. 1-18 TaxID=1333846 RepID=UPI00046EE7D3|nr:CueP family metal-binding protein [Paenibacillus sp. 1-18]